jgi:hypothetical protein
MDPLSIVGAAAAKHADETATEAAKVGSRLWLNIVEPTAHQIGMDLLSRYQNSRVQRVVAGADRRNPTGSIPLRLAAAVYEAASVSDEEVVSEYLSGILASSRTAEGENDSGLPWSALVARLPVNALRAHYLLYSTVHHAKRQTGLNLGQMLQQRVAIPAPALAAHFVGLEQPEDAAAAYDLPITAGIEVLTALAREGLVTDVNWGPGSEFAPLFTTESGVVGWPYGLTCKLLPAGVSLLFWGLGMGRQSLGNYCSLALDLTPLDDWALPLSIPELVFGVL